MTRSGRVTINAERVSPSATITAMANSAPLAIIGGRLLHELATELGGQAAATAFLLDLVERIGHPIALHVDTGLTTSRTVFIGPRSWTAERVKGWTAVYAEALADEFGECVRVGTL